MSEYFRKYIKKEHFPVHYSQIKFKTAFKNVILEALRRRGWKECDGEMDWELNWADKEWIHDTMDHVHLTATQRVNHFRNHYEITRKDLMIKNVKRHKKNLEKEGKLDEASLFDFLPQTYNLPSDYPLFLEEFKKNQSNNTVWIMKPVGKSQGKGIFLFNKLNHISSWKNNYRWTPENPQAEPYIVQRYVNNPLLIGGKKFDLRIYALVSSYQPLTIYLYRTGFARFTHHRYDTEDISNTYVHLTNVAVQKNSDNYDERIGGKWELRTLKLYMISKYGEERVNETFNQIQNVIIKSNQAVSKIIINDRHCFNLYGYDILIDANLKPWLLEVNASPSMTANTQADSELKIGLLDDVLTIIDVEKILTGQEEQIGGFDLIFKGAPIKLAANSTNSSLLGCFNNRNQQLKKLARNTAVRLAQTAEETKSNAGNPTGTTASTKTSTPVSGINQVSGNQMARNPGGVGAGGMNGQAAKNIRPANNVVVRDTKTFKPNVNAPPMGSKPLERGKGTPGQPTNPVPPVEIGKKPPIPPIGSNFTAPGQQPGPQQLQPAKPPVKEVTNPRASQSPMEKVNPVPSKNPQQAISTLNVPSVKQLPLKTPNEETKSSTTAINSKSEIMMNNLEEYQESDASNNGDEENGGLPFKEGEAKVAKQQNHEEEEEEE
jgi:tubulin polyglutamylase TTLL9